MDWDCEATESDSEAMDVVERSAGGCETVGGLPEPGQRLLRVSVQMNRPIFQMELSDSVTDRAFARFEGVALWNVRKTTTQIIIIFCLTLDTYDPQGV